MSLLRLLYLAQENKSLPVISLEKQQDEGQLRLWKKEREQSSSGFQSVH